MFEKITAIVNGRDRILAIWQGSQSSELYGIAKASGREVENTALRLGRITDDARLSSAAKRDDRKTAGLDSLRSLAKFSSRLETLRTDFQQRLNRLSAVTPYRDGDTATPLIDMEIARKLSAMDDPSARRLLLITGEQPRLTEAAMRLPPFLSGLTDAEHRRITNASLERTNPDGLALITQEGEDLDAATKAVGKAFRLIVEATGADLVTQIEAAGDRAEALVNAAPDVVRSLSGAA
ncbi:hypothetical protein [Pseudomonas asiatica]|uniref:hypothetical protein n=1 Tax=Pseudomonas asiatica TaxID=2219225 RepID=UPI003B94FFD4